MREYTQKHRGLFGKHPHDLLRKNHPVYLWRLAESSKIFMCYASYTACPSQQDIPRLTFQEVLSGRVTPHGSDPDDRLAPRPVLARTPEEVIAAKGVKPTLSPNLSTIALVE
ncbi:hypothetical protein ABZP36_010167, partial [Zizania latifolia]